MSAPYTPPFWLLAVDPALAHTGVAYLRVDGYDDVAIQHTAEVATTPRAPIVDRVGQIADELVRWIPVRHHQHATYGVIEEPTIMYSRGQRNALQTTQLKGIGYGAALATVLMVLEPALVRPVTVQRWYPKSRGKNLNKSFVLRQLRDRFPEQLRRGPTRKRQASEHEVMAVGLGLWWSREVAPGLYAKLEREAREASSRMVDTLNEAAQHVDSRSEGAS